MPIHRSVRRAAGLAVALLTAGVLAPGVAHAAPPDNDDFDTATVVGSLPFTAAQDTTAATKAADDPATDCAGNVVRGSVWFRYTATETGNLRVTGNGSEPTMPVTVYTGGRGNLQRAQPTGGDCLRYSAMWATLRVTAGTTYHLMVNGGGALKLDLRSVASPANDNFADAHRVTSLPFIGDKPDLQAATVEPGEPFAPGCTASEHAGSVWYSYTPTRTEYVLTEMMSQRDSGPSLSVHEGTSLADLRPISCGDTWDSDRVVQMIAGKTYYLQFRDYPEWPDYRAEPMMSVAPELQTSLPEYGSQSTYDPVHFDLLVRNDYPSARAVHEWDFGDGTTLPPTELRVQSHRYTKDGTYTVTIRSRTPEGRTATTSTTIEVSTHNVEVTKLVVPATARAGETHPINAAVKSHHGAERVVILLHRVYPGGSEAPAGERWIELPAQPAMSTFIQFHYRFTEEDVRLGTLGFTVRAQLTPFLPDARPLNNWKTAATTVS
ncbi:PKD domain-containing protein [Lentzea alba]|uniref:PKD domain-containing protein n=1 Tax=Lentzea alba TaxID=2714351 RepID=UPI0039BFA63B